MKLNAQQTQNINRPWDRIILSTPQLISIFCKRSIAKPHGIGGEKKKFKRLKRLMRSDVVGRGGRKNIAERERERERTSNLISIITKQSRGYRYRGRNIFPSNDHTRGRGRRHTNCLSPSIPSHLSLSL